MNRPCYFCGTYRHVLRKGDAPGDDCIEGLVTQLGYVYFACFSGRERNQHAQRRLRLAKRRAPGLVEKAIEAFRMTMSAVSTGLNVGWPTAPTPDTKHREEIE